MGISTNMPQKERNKLNLLGDRNYKQREEGRKGGKHERYKQINSFYWKRGYYNKM
jgi:hypothetical protein